MKTNILMLALLAAPLAAAPPKIVNGSLQTVGSLTQAPPDGWLGYTIAATRPMYISCCDGWRHCDSCRLQSDNISITRREPGDIGPVGANEIVLLAHDRDRVRVFSADCTLDADGQTISWIEHVSPSESIDFLRRMVDDGTKRGRDGALFALSLHAGATDTLIEIARHNSDR